MNPDQWRRIEQVFEAALEAPAEEWPALLEQACGGDGELRREVESLLAADRGYLNAIEAAISNQAADLAASGEELVGSLPSVQDEMRSCIQPRRRLR
jgi:eukaryotic-like serine/threonine-protein kinase